jgi:CBS domain-containing protein
MGLLQLAQEAPDVSPETSVMEAVTIMTAHGVGAIAITIAGRGRDQTRGNPGGHGNGNGNGNGSKKIVGVFTERDLMRRVVNERRDPRTTRMRDVMTAPVETVSDSTSVSEAAMLMRAHHIRHLAIVDEEGALLGMVAQRYLLYDLMDDLERKVDGLQSYIMVDGPGG